MLKKVHLRKLVRGDQQKLLAKSYLVLTRSHQERRKKLGIRYY
jgi:hypothetical protein